MNRYRYLIVLSLLLFSGCGDSSRPKDLPPLFPCVVSVTQGGKSLEGAYVELVSPDVQTYRPSATTGVDGDAVISTYGYPGAPEGKYKIIARKSIEDDIVHGTDEYGEKAVVSSNRYNVIQDTYGDVKKTPHEIEVTKDKKGVKVTVDVGDAIRVKHKGSD